MICLLEKNKRKLTPSTSSILISSFYKNAKEKGIRINIEIKDLLMSDEDYANTLCNKWLVEIEENSFDEAKYLKVIELAKEYNLNEPIFKAYDKISSYYYSKQNYLKALEYFKELLPLSFLIINKKEEVIIFNKIGTCYYMLQHLDKAFFYYNKGYEEFLELGIFDSELEDKLLYNLALCCSVRKNYKDTLMYIEKLESIVNVDKSEMYTNLILKANTYLNMNRLEEALNIYKEIINYDIKYLYIVQNNIALAFMRLGRLDESIEFFTKSINNQLDSLSPNTTISLTELAEDY
jgi:tetratricopeptide (TPR) repeat protein